MKEFKSIGFSYWPITILGFIFLLVVRSPTKHQSSSLLYNLWGGDYSFILDNIFFVISSLLLVIVLSINIISVDRTGIVKKLFLIPIVLNSKSWKNIKYYIEVVEIYNGQYGKSTTEAIWFIGDNNKVCLRFEKRFRNNLDEILKIIHKFETKNNNKLKISNPYFMSKGWTKIKLPETKP
jgi:hypothetical protein